MKKRNRKGAPAPAVLAAVAAAAAVSVFAARGCGRQPAEETSAPTQGIPFVEPVPTSAAAGGSGEFRGRKAGVSTGSAENGAMRTLLPILKRELEEQGFDPELVTFSDAGGDAAAQEETVRQLLADGAEVLLVEPVNPYGAAAITDMAAAAGVPLIYFGREPWGDERQRWKDGGLDVVYVGCDAEEAGSMLGGLVLSLGTGRTDRNGNGRLDYLMIEGDPEDADALFRTAASVGALTEAGLAVYCVDDQIAMWDPENAALLTSNALAQYGREIDVILANSDELALAASDAALEAGFHNGEELLVFGAGGTTEALAAVADGRLAGTVYRDLPAEARAAAEEAAAALRGDGGPAGRHGAGASPAGGGPGENAGGSGDGAADGYRVIIPHRPVTAENAAEVLGELAAAEE